MATLKKDIRQRELEAYERLLKELSPDGQIVNLPGKAAMYGMFVRAAARAGWFDKELTDDEIGDMSGKAVLKLGNAVDDLYGEMVNIPE